MEEIRITQWTNKSVTIIYFERMTGDFTGEVVIEYDADQKGWWSESFEGMAWYGSNGRAIAVDWVLEWLVCHADD